VSALLEVHEVVRGFDGVRAVDGATFDVEEGSITGLIGPNGAGKSTLFNCVSGFLRAQSGRVFLHGRRIDRLAPHRIARRGLVRTFQTPRTLTRMSVFENVVLAAPHHPGEQLGGALAGRARERESRARANELLALVGLDGHANALAGTLSGGQRKLLDLIRALMTEPRILLLDEPMAGVSAEEVPALAEVIRALTAGTGRCVLMVEHHMDVVLDLADRIAVLHHGSLLACDTPAVVMADSFVQQAYLGEDL
jgi:branched-chain amino acid transport system ATP-binding protein